jgi:hypothetical protein
MYSKQRLLIHIGHHKTGSTFVQKLIFQQAECGFYSPWRHKEYIEKLIICNPFAFDSNDVRSFFEPGIAEAWKKSLVPVISDEMLSGNPWKGGYSSRSTADRLFATFPEGRVLIVIREQTSMILSMYKHFARNYLSASIQRYLEPPKPAIEPLFRLEYLECHWLIYYYQQLFGKENVLVLPYEMIKVDKSGFLQRLSSFTETNIPDDIGQEVVNRGYSGLTIELKRWTNLFSPNRPTSSWYTKLNNSIFYHINEIIPEKVGKHFDQKLESYIKTRIDDFYQKSNRITAELTGLDLQAYGYLVEK